MRSPISRKLLRTSRLKPANASTCPNGRDAAARRHSGAERDAEFAVPGGNEMGPNLLLGELRRLADRGVAAAAVFFAHHAVRGRRPVSAVVVDPDAQHGGRIVCRAP